MTSVERIFRYRYIATEAPLRTPNKHRPSKDWPQTAKIIFKSFHMRYACSGDDVLKDLNFTVNSGEKVGIVGERSAGKSAVVQALLRLAFNEGCIEIDDISIDTLGLHDLRRCFGIIPANPILFRGSMRSNLDPLELRTDEEIWNALERVGGSGNLSNIVGGLSASASEQVFNAKQMQLLYLARALLAKNKILILDEATDALEVE
jgi:ABC-type multidrug transport system fused ATPase/permease subunit